MTTDVSAIRLVREPPVWAPPPERMSFSKLQQIESCPRRWSLMASDYPHIWGNHGYPNPLIQSTFNGQVIHRAVEIIVKEFHRRGYTSFDDAQAMTGMRELGGFSRVIEKSLDDILSQYGDNPRTFGTLAVVKRALQENKGEIRENVRILLPRTVEGLRTAPWGAFLGPGANGALRNGIHPEIRLVNEEMKWEGVADLIHLSSKECEIRDIKTGVPKEGHAEQLRIYSLLWLSDTRKNPAARPASKLTISYINVDVDVPPLLTSEVTAYKGKLMERTKIAQEKAAGHPPEAIPSTDNCHYCFVRHLCSAYWEEATLKMLIKDRHVTPMIDVEVKIVGVHGLRSYDAVSIASSTLPPNTPLIIRFSGNIIGCTIGNRIRLLDANITREEDYGDNGQVIISTTKVSEVYLMPDY